MASDIIDFIASFAILITVLGAAIYMSTQTLDNALVYQQNQLVSSTATDTFNTMTENPGSPSNWGETNDTVTSFGLQWASTGIDSLSPFTPLRLLSSPLTVIYDGDTYRDLSDLSGTSLLLNASEQVTYDQASHLLNLNGKYGWRLNYTAALDVNVTAWNPPPPSAWYWGWSYRTKVIIDHTKVLSNFNSYPVLLSITDTDLKTYAQSTGFDILFTDAGGVTKLSHEIESYDSSTGKLIVWVNVPSLSSWYDTELYMYFGNAAAPNQQDPTGTWNTSYLFVSHMKDDPDNSHIADSTANNLDGTKSATDEPVQSPGEISYAQRFDGSNDTITLLPKAGLSYTGFTFDFWAKSTAQQQAQTIFSTGAKSNSAGFIDITRSPSSYDLSFDYASNSTWLEKGLPLLDGIEVKCLAYFNAKIYAGTGDGRLYEWDGSTFWTLKAPQLGTETSINSLASYNSKLYGGTSPNGKLYEWDGSGAWVSRATLGAGTNILSLAVFGSTSKLYGGSSNGKLLEWTTGATVWTERAPQLGSETSIYSLTSFGSPAELYGSTGPNGKLYKWNGAGAWLDQITPTSIHSTIQFNGKIYGGTSSGELYEWDSTELKWVQRAPKLGSETDIMCLAEFGGAIYAGTSPGGRLYRWNGVDAWTQVAPQLGAETSIKSLIVYNSKIYGGTSPNGKLYEWNGVDSWVEDAGPALIHSLAFFNNKIYGGSFTGALYEWNGTAGQWLLKAPRLGTETDIVTLAVFNGKLYGGTSPNGKLYEWDGSATWVEKAGQLNGQTKINGLAVYNGKLYGGTSPGGRLFEWNGINAWAEKAPQLSAETSINSLASYNSKLYGGTSPNGKLYEWNGVNAWAEVAPQLFSETSINSLTVYNGKLYGGTSPGGRLYQWNDVNAWADQLGGWGYRKSHVINPSAGAGTNYQVKITAYYGSGTDSGANVYLNSKSRTDFGDVRFTKSDGTTPLDYWMESKVDGVNAVFWVEIADDLSSASSTIYLYYGKSDATTTSNGSNTFILFDDFNGPSLDGTKWTQKNGGALTFASGQMTATANAVDPGKIIATAAPTGNNLVLRARFKVTGGTSVDERAGLGVKTGTADGKGYNYVLRDFTGLDERSFLDDGVIWNVRVVSWLKDTWYTEEVYHDGAKINGRFDDGAWQSQAWFGRTGYPALNIGSFTSVTVWDWALIRKIVGSEPGHGSWVETSLGSETSINSLTVFNGKLYGGTSPNGRLYEWNDVDAWVQKADTKNGQNTINSLVVDTVNTKLYAATSPDGLLFEWKPVPGEWDPKTMASAITSVDSLAVFNGKLYGGTSPSGKLYEWNDINAWVEKAGQLNGQTKINGLAVYNSKLYGGTSPNGKLYEWNGVNAWAEVAPQLFSETSINSLTVYNGKLYGGTSPGGRLYQWNDVNAWADQLGGWGYRKSHVINPSAGAGTNYQVKITAYYGSGTDSGANVYLNSKSRTDFGDVRFTKSDGTTPLDYWMESKVDGVNAVFWVEIADDLSSASSTIYLYYGKSDATTTSNGSNTFILFDDFNGPSLDGTKWTQKNGGALTFASGQMTATANAVDPGKIIATAAPTGNNLVLRARFKVTGGTSVDERAGLGVKTGTADGKGYNYVLRDFTGLDERSFLDDGVIWNVRVVSWLKDTWYTEEVYHDGAKINGRFDDGAWQSQAWFGRTGYPALNIGSFTSVTVWDWALIRKIVGSEPGHGSWVETSLGSETSINSLTVFNGKLYGGTSPNGRLYEWNDVDAWVDRITPTYIPSLTVYNNKIYGGTSYGALYEWDSTALKWVQKAPRLGSETKIVSLTTFSGNLYGGTNPGGRLYQWNGVNAWVEKAPAQLTQTSINALVVNTVSNKLYGGTSPNGCLLEWDGTSSWANKAYFSQVASVIYFNNKLYVGTSRTGELFEWNGINGWTRKASQLGSETSITSLAEFNGNLYAGTYPNGMLCQWDGTSTWVQKAPKLGSETSINSLASYNSKLYGGTSPGGRLYEWNGVNAWVQKANALNGQTSINSLLVFNMELFGGTSPGGRLFKWDGSAVWIQMAPQLGAETSINSLASYNSKLYGGTSPNGKLFEWNGINAWAEKATKLGSETSINSLTVFNGKLYGGTSPNGKLYEWNTVDAWVEKASTLDQQSDVKALTVDSVNNRLYAGTMVKPFIFEFSDSSPRVATDFFKGYDDTWIKISIVADYSGKTVQFYRNGVLFSALAITSEFVAPTASPIYVGSFANKGNYFKGYLDELKVSTSARSDKWIATAYSNEANPENFYTMGTIESLSGLKLKVRVEDTNGVLPKATLDVNLFYCDHGNPPEFTQAQIKTVDTDQNGEAVINYPDLPADITLFAAVRARYTNLYGVGYATYTTEPDMIPFVTSYENGQITLVHKRFLDNGYPYKGKLNYSATMVLPIGYSEFRNVQIANPTGEIFNSTRGIIDLGALKGDPGVVIIFTRRPDTGKYAVTVVPWGLTLGSHVTFGESPLDATNVVSKSRLVMVGRYTYRVTLEMWRK